MYMRRSLDLHIKVSTESRKMIQIALTPSVDRDKNQIELPILFGLLHHTLERPLERRCQEGDLIERNSKTVFGPEYRTG